MTTGAGFGVWSKACGETIGIVVTTCEPCAFVDVTVRPGACDVVTTTLPWALVEVMTTFATALGAAAGTAVAAWL